ncbi:hypothetical protein WMY93_020480 [Mugilogobius chulae]|uniref:Uncharacterized protein n=1 Tax=Mugilogobius chulae TaxID=88201 RepID=A0AAW0NT70_9GOBI
MPCARGGHLGSLLSQSHNSPPFTPLPSSLPNNPRRVTWQRADQSRGGTGQIRARPWEMPAVPLRSLMPVERNEISGRVQSYLGLMWCRWCEMLMGASWRADECREEKERGNRSRNHQVVRVEERLPKCRFARVGICLKAVTFTKKENFSLMVIRTQDEISTPASSLLLLPLERVGPDDYKPFRLVGSHTAPFNPAINTSP